MVHPLRSGHTQGVLPVRSKQKCLVVGTLFLFSMMGAYAQTQPDFSRVQDAPFTSPITPRYERVSPVSINGQPDFLSHPELSMGAVAGAQVSSQALANVISVPNFQGSFFSRGKTWPFTMIGRAPSLGGTTAVPTRIVTVTLKLQNADLVTTTTVSVLPFVGPTLRSPNFQPANYTSGQQIQFADAVQRAEFFHHMNPSWHTELLPNSVVDHITINVPRFVTVTLKGVKTQVRTYFTARSSTGQTVVLLLDSFFNQQIFNVVVKEIGANHFRTNAMNMALFPNTFLFSLNSSGGLGACCVLGFHTFFTNSATPRESRWIFAFASWISPGIFSGGVVDVTALSHEISEAVDDPFVNNAVPAWQFPNTPGSCQDNLETGDPIETLANASIPIKTAGQIFHPQTEALLQWFEQKATSDAISGAFSYADTKALTHSATPFGPLTCP
jgi:hypothetical protein